MDSEPDSNAAELAGWTETDLSWERLQEAAAAHAKQGQLEAAAPLWAKALFLARSEFSKHDPRLATSLANHAYALRSRGENNSAEILFREALVVWDSTASWIWGLRIEHGARSSLFHLRMETRHRKTYEATARKRLHRFADEGRTAIATLAGGESGVRDLYRRWNGEKPPTFNDARKLLGAVFLIAPASD